MAVSVSRAHVKYLKPLGKYMYCFPQTENVYSFSITMFFRRNFHLMPRINQHVRNILESGFVTKWEKEDKKLIGDTTPRKENKSNYTVLTLDHVQGAFYLGFIGIGCAFLSFFVEFLVYYYDLYVLKLSKFKVFNSNKLKPKAK